MSIRHYQNVSRFWFILSVSSLGLACCLAIILVVSRMPTVGGYFDTATFQTALVLHVNFSLFIWLFAFSATLWTFYFAYKNINLHRLILLLSLLAIFGMLAAPWLHEPHPVLSNYLPVLDNSVYLASGLLFSSGFVVLLLDLSLSKISIRVNSDEHFFCPECLFRLMQLMLICLLMLPWVANHIRFEGHSYYELLFWGIGHQLQYIFTLLMVWAWVVLAKKRGQRLALPDRTLAQIFNVALLPLFLSLFIPLFYSPESEHYRQGFTWLMYSSPALIPVFVYALYSGYRDQLMHIISKSGVLSLALGLLILGLLLGTLINGNNLMVPAHYHAVTGAINLTLMGLGYELMPKIGFAKPEAAWQMRQEKLYASGVAFLALGLAWSGSLGSVRKMAEQSNDSIQQLIAVFTMGVGGLLSLLGCFLFLGLVFLNMRKMHSPLAAFPTSKPSFVKENHDA